MFDLAALVRSWCHSTPLRTLELPYVTPLGIWAW